MLTICPYVIGYVLCFDTSFSLPNSNRDLRFPNCRSDLLIATYCCRPSNRNILLMGCGKHYSNARFISQGEGGSRDREIAPTGEVSGERGRHWGKLASGGSRDREIAPTGRGQERGRHWGKLAFMGKVAIGRSLLQGRCQERVAIGGSWHLGRSRDREIAPTGEVSGERGRHWGKLAFMEKVAIGRSLLQGRCQERGRHWGKLAFMEKVAIGRSLLQGRCQEREVAIGGSWAFMEKVAIGRSLLQGRCQERVAIGGSWHQGEVAIGRSLLQGRCQERVAIGGSWHLWRKSRSGDRSYRGGVRRESPSGEVGIDGEVAIGRSLLQKT